MRRRTGISGSPRLAAIRKIACAEEAQGSVLAGHGQRLAGADAGASMDDAAEGAAVQEVLVADDQLHGGGVGQDGVGGVQELAG